ncbi:MAG: hypothetical protein NC247_01500, partial [Ruminococcus flavefaciens]|nr:hypothetical protein [Ruminococcus flavefaciens]
YVKTLYEIIGNTAQRPPDGFARHLLRPKEVPLGYIFSVISHKNFLPYDSMPASFLCNLTKNLTAHLPHNLCAVLPIITNCSVNFPLIIK